MKSEWISVSPARQRELFDATITYRIWHGGSISEGQGTLRVWKNPKDPETCHLDLTPDLDFVLNHRAPSCIYLRAADLPLIEGPDDEGNYHFDNIELGPPPPTPDPFKDVCMPPENAAPYEPMPAESFFRQWLQHYDDPDSVERDKIPQRAIDLIGEFGFRLFSRDVLKWLGLRARSRLGWRPMGIKPDSAPWEHLLAEHQFFREHFSIQGREFDFDPRVPMEKRMELASLVVVS